MLRVRHVYLCDGFGKIYSDDPRFGPGALSAALEFGRRLALREFGERGELLDISPGRAERRKKRSMSRVQHYDVLLGVRMGCGIYENMAVDLAVRVARARRSREYYDQPAVQPARDPDAGTRPLQAVQEGRLPFRADPRKAMPERELHRQTAPRET